VDRNVDINQEIEGEWIGMKISIKRLRERVDRNEDINQEIEGECG